MIDKTEPVPAGPNYLALRDETKHRELREWWESLDQNRGERAELRRCETPNEILPAKAFHRLCRLLPEWERRDLLALAVVAGVLAHVKESAYGSFPRQLGTPKEGSDKPLFSELRFQQLLASDGHAEFFQRLRRAIQQADGVADVCLLADGILHWAADRAGQFAERPSQRFRYTWARDYFQPTLKLAQGE